MPRRRLLVAVSPYAVHPPRRGGQTRIAGILGNLGDGWRVEHYSQPIQRTDLPVPPARMRVTDRWTEHRLRSPVALVTTVGLARLGVPPVHADLLLSASPHLALRRLLGRADAVLVLHCWQVDWVARHTPLGTPLVLDAANIERDLWRPRVLRSWFGRVITGREDRAWSLVDMAFATGDHEAARLVAAGIPEVVVVPNAADVERVRPATEADRIAARHRLGLSPTGTLAVFVGSSHIPNVTAVDVLERQADAYAAAGVTVTVVGRAGLGRRPVRGVIHAGEVADVLPWLHAADLALCPLTEGAGTSLKVAEYLAAGLPTVATPTGVRGLGLLPGTEAVVCEVDEMPDRVADLVADPQRMAGMAAAARGRAERALGWATAGRVAAAALDDVAGREGPSRRAG